MAERTDRLGLPLLAPGQAQKEMTHNEALAALDLAVQARVVTAPLDAPPVDPAPGECWIVGTAPTGEWAGHARALAGWTAGGWRFAAPIDGLTAWVADRAVPARFRDGAWAIGEIAGEALVLNGHMLLGDPVAAIATPSGGAVIDVEARERISSILNALRHHGLILAS